MPVLFSLCVSERSTCLPTGASSIFMPFGHGGCSGIIPLHREVSPLYVATVLRVAAQLEPPFAAARRRLLILIVDLQHLPKDPFPGTETGVHVHSDSCCSI